MTNIFIILILFFTFSILFAIYAPKIKGLIGEKIVQNILERNLDKDKYTILSNLTLLKNNDTTQIDFIVFSIYGIFVIEVKNYKGWIFGSENQKQWTQTIYKKKHKFQNPLHQNYKHIKFLETILMMGKDSFTNLVVFTGDSEFKTKLPSNVCTEKTMINYISNFSKPIFKEYELQKFIKLIDKYKLEDNRETDKFHVQNIKDRKKVS